MPRFELLHEGKTMVYGLSGEHVLIWHPAGSIDDADWDTYFAWLAPRVRAKSVTALFIVSRGAIPNPKQRSRFSEIDASGLSTIMVTEATALRAFVGLGNLLGIRSIQAFPPSRIREAWEASDAPAANFPDLRALLERVDPDFVARYL